MSNKIVCAWCGEVICEGDDDLLVSHGICPKCYDKEMKEDN